MALDPRLGTRSATCPKCGRTLQADAAQPKATCACGETVRMFTDRKIEMTRGGSR